MIEVDKIHFQSKDHKIMFIHKLVGGRTEFSSEDFQGNILATEINPTILFTDWARSEIEKLLDPRKI